MIIMIISSSIMTMEIVDAVMALLPVTLSGTYWSMTIAAENMRRRRGEIDQAPK